MFSNAPYSVSTARTFYNRPFFGAKLICLVTTVTSMQEELEQIIQDHSYLDIHHHQDDINAMACLSSMQNQIKTLAECVGRTRVLPRTRHGAIRTDTMLPRSVYTQDRGAEISRGESPQEDFRGFSWACSEDFTVLKTGSSGNMESRWSYSTDGSTATDSSSEYEEMYETADWDDDEEDYYPALEYPMVNFEDSDSDSVASSDTANSPDLEVDHVVILPDVGFAPDENTIAQIEAEFFEPRPETGPLPILRVPDTAEVTDAVTKRGTTITRRITELFDKVKSKVKITGKGGCGSCGPSCRGMLYKGRLWCKRCGHQLSDNA